MPLRDALASRTWDPENTTVYVVCTVATAYIGGLWSDRAGRRTAFVT